MIFLFYLFSECRLYQSSDCRSFRKIRASWISSKKLNQSESLYFVLDCKLHPQLICLESSNSVCRTQRWLIGQSGESCFGWDSLCVQTWFLFFFFVYKTFLKSEEQYFLPTKNKYSVCREVISEWMDKAAMTV